MRFVLSLFTADNMLIHYSINLASATRMFNSYCVRIQPPNAVNRFESEAVPGTIPHGQNSPRNVRFGLYAEQVTATAFVAPRHCNKKAWLYRARPAVAHQGFVRWFTHGHNTQLT